MKKVLVFMGTYNGEKYIDEQVESIMQQEQVDVKLAIRDDCSTDNTPQHLLKLKKQYGDKLFIELGKVNLYPYCMNALFDIFDLNQYDYFAFSDHDDVWMKDKLITAVTMLDSINHSQPCLYYSNLSVTDEALNFKFNVYGKNKIKSTYKSCFVDIAASSNTFVFNKSAFMLFKDGNQKDCFYGDVWQQFLCFFVGDVVYDDVPHILFRRTGNNVSGDRPRGIKLWISRIKKIKKEKKNPKHMHSEMAKTILENYSSYLDADKIRILQLISNCNNGFKNRMKLLFSKDIKSKSFSKNICFKGRILLGLL